MKYSFYALEKKPPIAWVYLNRPEKKNAMNPPAWTELVPIMQDIDEDDEIRVVIIAAKGETFCAGIDLIQMIPEMPEIMDKDQKGGIKLKLLQKILTMQDGLSCIEECRKPVIAAVQGECIGAGLDLITACDIRLSSADAEFCLKETAVGFVADMGVLQRIPLIVGQGIARELAFTAKTINAARAREILLVNEVYADKKELIQAAEQMAADIAANSPIGVRATKDVFNEGRARSVKESLKYNASISTNVLPSNDLIEAVTAFSQKRKPNFSGT